MVAFSFVNNCIWVAASSGTGSFVVSAATQNGYTPANCADPAVVDGGWYHYFATNGAQHEEGDGQYTVSTTTLTRSTIRNSSSAGGKVTFNSTPIVFMGGPTSLDMGGPQVATGNIALYVATTGNDNNAGTSGSPFLTIQHAVNVAAQYNYQSTYTLTINVADGTYAVNGSAPAVLLEALTNYPIGVLPTLTGNVATPANCIVSNTSFHAMQTGFNAQWSMGGFKLKTTAGTGYYDLLIQNFSQLSLTGPIELAGNGSNLVAQNYGAFFGNGKAITVSSSSGYDAFNGFYHSDLIVDGSTITFTGTPTYSHYVIFLQDRAIFGNPTWVNANTVSGHSASIALYSIVEYTGARNTLPGDGTVLLYDLGIYEGDSNSSSFIFGNGAAPGDLYGTTNTLIGVSAANALVGNQSGNTIIGQYGLGALASGSDNTAIGQGVGDAVTSGTGNTLIGRWTGPSGAINGVIGFSDGSGNLELDCLYTNAAGWTAQVSNNPQDVFYVQSSNATSTNLHIKSTDTAGKDWILYSGATSFAPGEFGLFDNTTTQNPFSINDTGVLKTLSTGVYGWTSSTQFSASGLGTLDTGFSRLGAASVALGDGTPGDKTGQLTLKDVILTPLTVATLPAASGALKGARAFVTDELAAVAFNTIATGGGANNVPVFCDGTTWRIG